MIIARLQAVTALEQRSAPRRLLNLGARTRASASAARDVSVAELSPGGCRIAPAGSMQIGDQAWLKLPSLEAVGCSIMSVEDSDAVCVFHRMLHPGEVDLVRAQVDQPAKSDSFGRRRRRVEAAPAYRGSWFDRLLGGERGATAIEYAMVAALIAIAGIVAFQQLGTQIQTTFDGTSDALEEATK
ncbi:MAG TPA: Flp family type IVb pilin [Allosphingosinicella sp.]|jgi:pilus assembly protein Flp/PilA